MSASAFQLLLQYEWRRNACVDIIFLNCTPIFVALLSAAICHPLPPRERERNAAFVALHSSW